ncbi:hypothetical protein P7C73_g3709, partial [Tremellales sp. Uapishka_1]
MSTFLRLQALHRQPVVSSPFVIHRTSGALRPELVLVRRSPLVREATGRSFSSSSVLGASQRARQFQNIIKDFGPSESRLVSQFALLAHDSADWKKLSVPTKQVLEALRDMQSERAIANQPDKSNFYRDGLRAIYLLAGADGGTSRPNLTFEEIKGVLSEENGVTWRLLRELFETGHVLKLTSLSEKEKAAVLFNRVHGIGKAKAEEFAEAGARTLQDLAVADKLGKRKVTPAMKLGLLYYRDMEIMVPRAEIQQFEQLIRKALTAADPTSASSAQGPKRAVSLKPHAPPVGFQIMGSYRRGEAMSSDIDLIVWHQSHKHQRDSVEGIMGKILEALGDADLVDPDKFFSSGAKKTLGLTRLPKSADNPAPVYRQIDIRLCPTDSIPYMLLGNTGDDELMKILRRQAIFAG